MSNKRQRIQLHAHQPELQSTERLQEKEGARSCRPSYGNYAHYYGYRRTQTIDPRLLVFESTDCHKKRILDIGCNDGSFLLDLVQMFSPSYAEGIDIDPKLVSRARSSLRNKMSLMQPDSNRLLPYFPKSCLYQIGSSVSLDISDDWSSNTVFRCADIMSIDTESVGKFDAIVAFSITKWIHLNHGDAGIRKFFKKCCDALHIGGVFYLEIQPWSSYKKRSVMVDNVQRSVDLLWMPENFPEYLIQELSMEEIPLELTRESEPAANASPFNRNMVKLRKVGLHSIPT